MSRHQTYRVLITKSDVYQIDLAAPNETSALGQAETLWKSGSRSRFQRDEELDAMSFVIDDGATLHHRDSANEDRARWAKNALQAFSNETKSSMGQEALHDLALRPRAPCARAGSRFPSRDAARCRCLRSGNRRGGAVMTTLAFQDLSCPRCGHSGSFHIDVVATAFVDARGACVESDYYWDGNSSCACLRCSHEALVSDFCTNNG